MGLGNDCRFQSFCDLSVSLSPGLSKAAPQEALELALH